MRSELAREYKPTAITLDMFLPDMLGWTVLNQLKRDPATRHIPVQIITVEEERQHGLERGAFSFMDKPVTTDGLEAAFDRIKRLHRRRACGSCWSIEDDPAEQLSISELLAHDDVEITHRRHRRRGAWTCCASAPSIAWCWICGCRTCPASSCSIACSWTPSCAKCRSSCSPAGSCREARRPSCARKAKSIVLKGVQSPERLLDETALFLHRVVTDLPPAKQQMIETLHQSDEALRGRKVLVVDDDVRNIFALTSLLERHNMEVISATNGQDAIRLIESDAGPVAGADGHHDAGDGRLRDHAAHPQRSRSSGSCRSSR